MTEDLEKKPKFILNKQRTDQQPAAADVVPEKKKVVVVKKKPSPAESATPAVKVKVPVVRSDSDKSSKADDSDKKPVAEEVKPRPVSSIELSPPRPNIKQGNLADKPKPAPRSQNQGPRRDYSQGQGQNQQRREGGFTGAQAREGYQNRNERGGYQGTGQPSGQNQGQNQYQNRPSGYQGGGQQGGQTRSGPYQGGNQGRPGGYQGTNQGRPGGYQGGGQGRPGGYQGGNQGRPGGYQGGGQGRPGGFAPRPPFGGTTPAPMEENKKVPSKKTFKAKKTVYSKKDREDAITVDKLLLQKKKQVIKANPIPKQIEIMESVSVSDLAKKMNLKASEIIGKLMSMGMMVSITQSIDADTATLLASEYNCDVKIISLYDETVIESVADIESDMKSRPPVVTIMGHVDHGKTKTLDAIRLTKVAEGEFGGITQHVFAYMVDTPKGSITFIDTPGHEVFSMMRARGAQITDIVVLVVAADDGVMPQTVEAINHARDARVPIIVAVNKIDKPEANPDRVKTQLSDYGLIPEEWGGDTQFVHISALKKEGLDDLLDAILLQAEVLELRANWNCRAEGKVVESRIDHGRGVVSSIIVERGILRTGDSYVAGIYSGRVRALFDDRGNKITEATPSMPVEILGSEDTPAAGDPFQVTENEREARAISSKRQELKRLEVSKTLKKVTLDNLYDTITAGEMLELKVVIKADVQGTAEALKQSLEKLSTNEIRLVVIHSSAGAINESDVRLAAADSNALIIGFNVRPTPKAKALADQEKVDIRKYNIIYKAVEEVAAAMQGMLKPELKEEVIGSVEVRDTFKVPKIGTIAGSYVLTGVIKRTSSVNIIRDGIVIYSGKVTSLKRFKDDAREVAAGYECGIGIDSWNDIKVGDQFEVVEFVEVARTLGDSAADAIAAKERAEDAKARLGKDNIGKN